MRTFKLCVLIRWDFNSCVCSSPLRERKPERLNVVDVDDGDEFAFGVTCKKKPELVNIVVWGVEITAMIDSGGLL